MFVEIPMMQKLTLTLGSPIYSLSVTLGALLVSSGLGSALVGRWQRKIKKSSVLVGLGSASLVTLLLLFVYGGTALTENFLFLPLAARILLVCLTLFPFGLCLGIFFPLGLSVVGEDSKAAIAWAWGINCGATVLGSFLAIFIAQFYGFNRVLLAAGLLYLIAGLAFRKLSCGINESARNHGRGRREEELCSAGQYLEEVGLEERSEVQGSRRSA